MDGEIPRGLTGQARLDAARKVRETQMKYLVRWRRQDSDSWLQSEVNNVDLKKKAPQAIIRFFEVRFEERGFKNLSAWIFLSRVALSSY